MSATKSVPSSAAARPDGPSNLAKSPSPSANPASGVAADAILVAVSVPFPHLPARDRHQEGAPGLLKAASFVCTERETTVLLFPTDATKIVSTTAKKAGSCARWMACR